MATDTPQATLLARYLRTLDDAAPHPAAAAFYASLDALHSISPVISAAILQELADQRQNLKLIASENYSSLATQLASGNLLTDKYAEGYPAHRFSAGCDSIEAIESEFVILSILSWIWSFSRPMPSLLRRQLVRELLHDNRSRHRWMD